MWINVLQAMQDSSLNDCQKMVLKNNVAKCSLSNDNAIKLLIRGYTLTYNPDDNKYTVKK